MINREFDRLAGNTDKTKLRRSHPSVTIPRRKMRVSLRRFFETTLTTDHERPHTRAECINPDLRPCPFVGCRHHLYLDVAEDYGSIKINFPELEPWEMIETCSLDMAECGGMTLANVGELMNLTRERVRQIESKALDHALQLDPDFLDYRVDRREPR